MNQLELRCGRSAAQIDLRGAKTLARFELEGREISPFYAHPWAESETDDKLLENLAGDFFCAPFGEGTPENGGFQHGFSSQGTWVVSARTEASATLALRYPGGPIESVRRTVTLGADRIAFDDSVLTRSDCLLPVGIHPIFRLPSEPGGARLVPPEPGDVWTFPTRVDESSVFAPKRCVDPRHVPKRRGGSFDTTRLPFKLHTEELLLFANVAAGRFALENLCEGYRAVLEWESESFRNCLVWFSNFGRTGAPWKGRNLCVGIEPVTAAFDEQAGRDFCAEHPEIPAVHGFRAGVWETFSHAIRVENLD